VIAFPTDTLYAVGVRAADAAAIGRLYAVKRRPQAQPLVFLVRGEDEFGELAQLSDEARRLMRRFWPGPLTIVLPSHSEAGGTVAGRAPDHPVALAILDALGEPIASSSANRAGAPPPSDAESVISGFGEDLDLVLDGGPSRLGQPSTILDLSGVEPKILRSGAIAEADLQLS
jgi:L-threonylcarbamoyladenylate synthase